MRRSRDCEQGQLKLSHHIVRTQAMLEEEDLKDAILLVMANKQDMKGPSMSDASCTSRMSGDVDGGLTLTTWRAAIRARTHSRSLQDRSMLHKSARALVLRGLRTGSGVSRRPLRHKAKA